MTAKGNVHVPHGSTDGEVLAHALTAAAYGIPFVITIPVAGGATKNVDYTVRDKIRVLEVWAVHAGAGAASDTLQLKNGTNAISDALDWSGGDKAVVRAGEIDDAYHEIAKGGTLRVTLTDATGEDAAAAIMYVLAAKAK